jgi:cell division protein FtsL
MKRLPPNHANSKVHRERDVSALSRLALLLFCGLVLTGGFLFAARQHFAAIQYGYKNEELRREHQRLEAEQKRLLLEKEEASSPSRLEPAAREIGLQPVQPGQIVAKKENKSNESHPAVLINPSASLRR